jgi:hypothetical protein
MLVSKNSNNMKIKRLIYLLLAGATVFASCKKEFLDEKPPTAVPVADAIKTENDLADAVNGMYSAMRASTFYGRDIPVIGDELADVTYISGTNSGRYLAYQNYSYIAGTAEPANIWGQGYFTILQANRIIYAANSMGNTNNVNQLKGEAYIVRALCYLQLVNFFAPPFTVNPAADGVPLVTAPTNVIGPFAKPSKSTSAVVYAKIISDLDSAFAIMPAAGTTLHAINSEYLAKYAAKAIQSRAYLYKGDYANARDAALAVVTSGGYTLTPSTSYVAYWANPAAQAGKVETIFELALNSATNNGTNGLDNFYWQNAGYGDALVYTDLYNSYSATDVRKALITTTSPTRGAVLGIGKYTAFNNASEKDDIKVIRYAEVLLTLAEGYARTGNDLLGLQYLNQVAKQRDPSFTGYVSVGAALLTDILNERKKELAFEGLRYWDLTRLNLQVVRPVQAGTAPTAAGLAVDNPKRIFPIPQGEIDANPNIKQNTGY